MTAQIVALGQPTDRAWFKKNPSRNYRVRHIVDEDELESLLKQSVPASTFDRMFKDNFKHPGRTWRVLVINIDRGAYRARILTSIKKDKANTLGEFGESGSALPAVLGQRVVVDSGD